MYVRCRMSTYDIVCQTYDVVRLLEVAVSAVLKEPDPLPTAQANERCLSYSKSFMFSLATSKTVSETLSLLIIYLSYLGLYLDNLGFT